MAFSAPIQSLLQGYIATSEAKLDKIPVPPSWGIVFPQTFDESKHRRSDKLTLP